MLLIFSSVPLARYLSEKCTGYYGTMRAHGKHIPEFVDDKAMKKGNFEWRIDSTGISVTKWMDNRAVYFMSNIHNPSHEQQSNRRQKDGSLLPVVGTQVNTDYDKNMYCVDKADMLN